MEQNVFLIGAGAVARTHARAAAKLPADVSVNLFVSDPSEQALQSFVEQFPHARTFADAAVMLASQPAQPDDIVIVAAPPFMHYPLTRMALESGRNTLCEKPFAMNAQEAEAMLALARSKKLLLGCCSARHLGLPSVEAAKEAVRTRKLGRLYHATFVNRGARTRPGIEYQPASRWFLDKSKSGGGPLMDWGPYDFAALNDMLAPVRVDVLHAWMETPSTGVELPAGIVNDAEQHAGATLLYYLQDGTTIPVTYERAACTHGQPRSAVEIEGTDGAVSWDWLPWVGSKVTVTTDVKGEQVSEESELGGDARGLDAMDKPLVYFYEHLHGIPSPAIVDEQALFNFSCIQAVYTCAQTGERQSVTKRTE